MADAEEAVVDAAGVHALLSAALEAGDERLDLAQSWALLSAYGIAVAPATAVRGDEHEVVATATDLGYPVALKAAKRRRRRSLGGRRHRPRPGHAGQRRSMRSAVMRGSLGPDADEVTVQRMVPPGVDVRIRCVADDVGPVVIVDLGSLPFARAGDGEASRLAPLSATGAAALVAASPVAAALAATGLSPDLLVDAVVRVSHLVADHPQIAELDLNPLIVSTTGCTVTDAKVTVRPTTFVTPPLRQLS